MNLIAYLNSDEFLQQLLNSRFFVILFVLLISNIKHSSYDDMVMAWFINILGTIFHETAHFVVGTVLNAKPTSFTLFPKKVDGMYVMGSVGFKNMRFYNAIPAALAPLSLLVLAYYVNKYFFNFVEISVSSYIIFIFLLSVLIENSMLSKADIKAALISPLGVLLYTCLGGALLFFLF